MTLTIVSRMGVMKPLQDAIRIVRGTNELARRLHVSLSNPHMWLQRKHVPVVVRPGIEFVTNGRVRVEAFGKDARWIRVPDASWPGGRGRPLLDLVHADSALRGG